MVKDETQDEESFEVEGEPKSSSRILAALQRAQDATRDWQDTCRNIDEVYSLESTHWGDWGDPDFDLFWASYEILKPAVYARPPQPVISPQFNDRRPLPNATAELLERVSISMFARSDIDDVMCQIRDDLIFTNRGVMWLLYENEDGEQKICIEHLDRKDFLHEPTRKWAEVGWVARRAWMTKAEMRKRFRKTSGDAYQESMFKLRRIDEDEGSRDRTKKAGVWEVWHRADNRVYWVSENVDVILDEGEPHLKLKDFFPCPRPAFGTLRRRTLIPIPDYQRYKVHFDKINALTSRIYLLLEKVKMKGLIPAGGDVSSAVEELMSSDDDSLLIPVPSAAMMNHAGNFVVWLPIAEIAQAISGLIEARRQLMDNYYELSGISDIMRGATEAQETLGAQQLKSQYGSIRIRHWVDELQRLARDAVKIAAEVIAEKFTKETILEMSQMEFPTRSDIEKDIKSLSEAAELEIEALGEQAEQAAMQAQQSGEQIDPQQAEQQFQQAQQQIIAKYDQQFKALGQKVAIEDIMDLLRDDRARGFAFEIEDKSTILTDELQEKQSRAEFLQVVSGATAGLSQFAAMGPSGAALAGGMLKFAVAPYRVGRELDGLIDDFVDSAPEMASQEQPNENAELAEAQMQLAQAEIMKAQAQGAKVQADAALKEQELMLRAQEAQAKSEEAQAKFMLSMEETQGKIAETQARIERIYAEIQKLGFDVQTETREQDREDVKTAASLQDQQFNNSMRVRGEQRQDAQALNGANQMRRGPNNG